MDRLRRGYRWAAGGLVAALLPHAKTQQQRALHPEKLSERVHAVARVGIGAAIDPVPSEHWYQRSSDALHARVLRHLLAERDE